MYETGSMSQSQAVEFEAFLIEKIGTDFEVNESAASDGKYYLVIIDLELDSEYTLIREFELSLNPPTSE